MPETTNIIQIPIVDGRKHYQLTNEAGEVVADFHITPTDAGIFERLSKMEDEINDIVKPVEDVGEDFDLVKYGDIAEQVKDRMFAAINKVFGEDVAGQLFARVHPLSPVEGRFYFDRVMEAVGSLIEAAMETETAQFNGEKVKKYTNRAQRRAAK